MIVKQKVTDREREGKKNRQRQRERRVFILVGCLAPYLGIGTTYADTLSTREQMKSEKNEKEVGLSTHKNDQEIIT